MALRYVLIAHNLIISHDPRVGEFNPRFLTLRVSCQESDSKDYNKDTNVRKPTKANFNSWKNKSFLPIKYMIL